MSRASLAGLFLALSLAVTATLVANSTTTSWDIGPDKPSCMNSGPYGRSQYTGVLRLRFSVTSYGWPATGTMQIKLYGGKRGAHYGTDQNVKAAGVTNTVTWPIARADSGSEFWYYIDCNISDSQTSDATLKTAP